MMKNHIPTGGDKRDHKRWIINTIEDFYDAYYQGDRLALYSFFNTDFQRAVPLNVFLYHPKYRNFDLGILKKIEEVKVVKVDNKASVTLKIEVRDEVISTNIDFKMEFGKWKIVVDRLF